MWLYEGFMETLTINELIDLLKAQGVDRTTVARACGVSYSVVSNALAGRWLSLRTAKAIANGTGTRVVIVGDEIRFSGNVLWRQ